VHPASRCPRAVARALVLFGATVVGGGCRGDDSVPGFAETSAHQVLNVTRERNAPVPVVQAELELSPFALEHFTDLWITVQVESGQALEGHGVLARWFGDAAAAALPETQADFEGALANSAQLRFWLDSPPCAAAQCLVTLELSPGGDWTSDVPFPIDYDVQASVALDHTGQRGVLRSDLTLRLQVVP